MKLTKEQRDARNAYFRKWRNDNPDKVKRHARKFWQRKAEELRAEEKQLCGS